MQIATRVPPSAINGSDETYEESKLKRYLRFLAVFVAATIPVLGKPAGPAFAGQ
jgi:hypothetical protein